MRRLAILGAMLLVILIAVSEAHEKSNAKPKVDVKRCAPRVVRHNPAGRQPTIRFRKGEKSTGFSPVIAFQILASGEVAQAHVKRSSGIADIDTYALNWIEGTKYNARPGCGMIESEADVTIDFR